MNLTKLQVRHATTAIQYDVDPGSSLIHTVEKAWLIDCDTGLYVNNATVGLNNTTKCNVGTLIAGYGYVNETGTKTRCEVVVNDPNSDSGLTRDQRRQRESSLALYGANLVVGYGDGRYANVTDRKETGWSLSANGGASFEDKDALPTPADGEGFGGDPALATRQDNGTIYFVNNPSQFVGNKAKLRFFRSTDGGASFSFIGNSAPGFTSADVLDKPWLAVDNSTGTGQNNIYQVFKNHWTTGSSTKPRGIYFSRSTNDGANWDGGNGSDSALIDEFADANDQIIPFVTTGSDHTVYIFYYKRSKHGIFCWRSSNQGQTFSPVSSAVDGDAGKILRVKSPDGYQTEWFLDIRLNSGSTAVVRNICSLQAAANPLSGLAGHIYVVYPDQSDTGAPPQDRANIYLIKSTDFGDSWTQPDKVNDDSGPSSVKAQWNPALAVKPNGSQLFIGFYDRRGDPNDSLRHAFGVIWDINTSTGAFTKKPNFQVSASNFPATPEVDGSRESDYDTAAADNSYFYYAWSDHRDLHVLTQAFKDANIWFTKIQP